MQGYQSLGTVLCKTGLRMDGALSECSGCPACGPRCAGLSGPISGQVEVPQPWIFTSWCCEQEELCYGIS